MEKELVLFGHGGSYNHGCEAIVRSTLGMLEKQKMNQPVSLYSSNPASDRDFALDKLVRLQEQRSPFRATSPSDDLAMVLHKFLHRDEMYLKRFFSGKMDGVRDSLCLSVGGDMYCYGRLNWLYYIHSLLKANGNKTMLWGCSVDKSSFEPESRQDLERYDRIIVRESVSLAMFQEYGFGAKPGLPEVRLYPDPAFTLEPEEVKLPFTLDGPNTVAVNISPLMKRYQGQSPLAENITRLFRHLLEDTPYTIVLLPHVNGWSLQEDDHAYLKSLMDSLVAAGASPERIRLLGRGYNCRELKYVVSQCRFLVTARTHASIAAYSTAVPTLVLGYSVKSRGIARDIFGDEKNYVVPIQRLENTNQLANAFDWIAEHETDIRTHLQGCMPEYIGRAFAATDEIRDLMA